MGRCLWHKGIASVHTAWGRLTNLQETSLAVLVEPVLKDQEAGRRNLEHEMVPCRASRKGAG